MSVGFPNPSIAINQNGARFENNQLGPAQCKQADLEGSLPGTPRSIAHGLNSHAFMSDNLSSLGSSELAASSGAGGYVSRLLDGMKRISQASIRSLAINQSAFAQKILGCWHTLTAKLEAGLRQQQRTDSGFTNHGHSSAYASDSRYANQDSPAAENHHVRFDALHPPVPAVSEDVTAPPADWNRYSLTEIPVEAQMHAQVNHVPLFNQDTALQLSNTHARDTDGTSPRYLHGNDVTFPPSAGQINQSAGFDTLALAQLPRSDEELASWFEFAIQEHERIRDAQGNDDTIVRPWIVLVNPARRDALSQFMSSDQLRQCNDNLLARPSEHNKSISFDINNTQFHQMLIVVETPLDDRRCITAETIINVIDDIHHQISDMGVGLSPAAFLNQGIFFSHAGVGRNAAIALTIKAGEALKPQPGQISPSDEQILDFVTEHVQAMRRDRGPHVLANFDQIWEIASAIRQLIDR